MNLSNSIISFRRHLQRRNLAARWGNVVKIKVLIFIVLSALAANAGAEELFCYKVVGYLKEVCASEVVSDYIFANEKYTGDRRINIIKALYRTESLDERQLNFLTYLHFRGMGDGLDLLRTVEAGVEKILEIGGGISASTLFLLQHLEAAGQTPSVMFAEQPQRSMHGKDFDMQAIVFEFFRNNGVDLKRLQFIDGTREQGRKLITENRPFDLVYSFRSLAYHFPLDIYFPYIKDSVTKGGAFLTDVRRVAWYDFFSELPPTFRVASKLRSHFNVTLTVFSSRDKVRILSRDR